MTEERLPLAELLAKGGEADFLRTVAEAVLQQLMEGDVEELIGAGWHERSAERLNLGDATLPRLTAAAVLLGREAAACQCRPREPGLPRRRRPSPSARTGASFASHCRIASG
jgi:hypothetical protein